MSGPPVVAQTIAQLNPGVAVSASDQVAIVQAGKTVRVAASALAAVAGAVVSLNGINGLINLVAGTNVSIVPSGQNITISALGIPAGTNLQVQYNNNGVLGGYTNVQLTALINSFTSSLSGATPASGGGTSNFLRADGTWASPAGSGGNVSSAITSTNGELAAFSGTGGTTLTNSFFVPSGPTASAKTFTFPNASATVLTSAAAVTGAQGGTGVSNSGLTITLGGNISTAGALTTTAAFITSGANSLTLTTTAPTNVTLPTSGTLITNSVTTLSSLTSIGTIGTGVWQGSVIAGQYGGTGMANTGKTITLGGNVSTAGAFTTSGAFGITLTVTALTSITLPTSGTLITTTANNIAFTGGTITGITLDNSVIGGVTPAAGSFTTLNSSGLATLSRIAITGAAAVTNGLALPSANAPSIYANSQLSAQFTSVASAPNGVDVLSVGNTAISNQNAITSAGACTSALAGLGAGNLSNGTYSYKITFVSPTGETVVGTASNITTVVNAGTNGQINLTAIPVSGNGTVTARNIYRTFAGGGSYLFLHQIANNSATTYTDNIQDSALGWSGPTTQGQVPTYITIGPTAFGGDSSVGIQYRALGTTTTGFQVNGSVGTLFNQGDTSTTGTHDFYCNGALNFRVTDNYANVNQVYPGAVNGYVVISGGWGDTTLTSDAFTGSISVEAPAIYPGHNLTGLTLLIGSKGPSGQIHFTSNGAIGHVTVDSVQGTNPTGNDVYVGNNSIRLRGSMTGQGFDPVISTQFWAAGDSGINLLFYHQGTGGFDFKTDNTATSIFSMKRSASGGDGAKITAQTAGTGPLLQSTGNANAPFTISSNGTGSVVIQSNTAGTTLATFANAGSLTLGVANSVLTCGTVVVTGVTTPTNGIYLPVANKPTIAANSVAQMEVTTTAAALNLLSISGGATGAGPTITVGGASVEANPGINFKALGSGQLRFYNAGAQSMAISGSASVVNYLGVAAGTTGVDPAISAQGGDAAVGLTIYTTGTGNISFKTANTSNTVLALKNNFDVIVGKTTQATTDTSGFFFIQSVAGAQTGVPATIPTNGIALMYDRTNNKLYAYNGAWRSVTLA